MANLKGKVAVVTGAAKGIGAAIAKALAAAGAAVVVNYAGSKEAAVGCDAQPRMTAYRRLRRLSDGIGSGCGPVSLQKIRVISGSERLARLKPIRAPH